MRRRTAADGGWRHAGNGGRAGGRRVRNGGTAMRLARKCERPANAGLSRGEGESDGGAATGHRRTANGCYL